MCSSLKRHGGTRHRREQQGASTTLTGNTNVTVKDNAIVAGAIIGGSTSSHNAVTTITGNTSVLVTNIQHSNSATVNLGRLRQRHSPKLHHGRKRVDGQPDFRNDHPGQHLGND